MPEEEEVLASLRTRGWRLVLAESVTCGRVAARLSRLAGLSSVLWGGFVVYSGDAKRDLGLDAALLRRVGTVAPETAKALADAARARSGVEVALATVGNAGPEPDPEGCAPVGRVHLHLRMPGGERARTLDLEGDREAVLEASVAEALRTLADALRED